MKWRKVVSSLPYIRLSRFAIVGVSGVVVSLGLLYSLSEFAGWHYMASYGVAFIVAAANNYLWNSLWTFRDRKSSISGLGIYTGVSMLTLMLNESILYILTGLLGLWYIVSALVSLGIAFILNYAMSSRFVWNRPRYITIVEVQ